MVTQNQIMIILATYNRAPILKRTLDAFCTLECDNLNVEFVVIDNNSTDNTKQLIESFASKLPITYLFEPRPGKNCALNKALTQLELAPIIVFTDDDVIPDKNWLAVIASACSQWPQYSIFGGRIYAIWPGGIVPNWAADKQILELGFACHDHGDSAKEYKAGSFPFGPNFWVRKKVFANGILFDETIGPMPKGRTMGSETSLLKKISEDGLKMLYYPDARVGHIVETNAVSKNILIKRAYRYGRGVARLRQLCRKTLFDKNPLLWYAIRICAVAKYGIQLAAAKFFSGSKRGFIKTVENTKWFAYNIESIRTARSGAKK